MQSIVKKLLASSLLLLLPLVTGCGKDGNPMAPEPPNAAAPESLDVKVTLVRVFAVADGDGIEGPGDFRFEARVYDGAPQTLTVTGFEAIETGSSYGLNKTRVIRAPKDRSYNIEVRFNATEWDGDIFGGSWPDTRMDNLTEKRTHTDASSSNSFNDGERWITLGTGDLQLRLVYTITSTPAPVPVL